MLTRLMMDKIHRGITVGNSQHADSTQPLLFSEDKERPEWDWLKHDEDFDFE